MRQLLLSLCTFLNILFNRHVQKLVMKLKTSLCYNPDLERLTLTIYDLKGLEVSMRVEFFKEIFLKAKFSII